MKVLVTGGGGQLSTELLRRPKAASLELVGASIAELDITNPAAVAAAVAAVDLVVNAAAYTAVDRAEDEPDLAFAVNRDGPAYLAAACAHKGVPLIHVSTDYVFDGTKPTPYDEDDPVCPLGAYGVSKAAGEQEVRDRLDRHLILRTSWVYAAHGANFIRTMLRLAQERDELRVVADQSGAPTAAADLADAILAIAERLATGTAVTWGTFHCTGSGATTWHGLAEHVFQDLERRCGRRPRLTAITSAEYPTRAHRPANSRLDCRRLAAEHGVILPAWTDAVNAVLDEIHGGPPHHPANGLSG